jgi:uncharacterized protein (DUF1810 family)
MAEADLARFLAGYRESFDQALAEIRRGGKRTHWMWFIFPQVDGLGTSPTAVQYAIHSRAEADAFLADPALGAGYRQLVDAVWTQVITKRVSIRKLFGSPDDQKLVSSLTLFAGVATDLDDAETWARFVEQADTILDQAETQHLPRCAVTQRFLETSDARP